MIPVTHNNVSRSVITSTDDSQTLARTLTIALDDGKVLRTRSFSEEFFDCRQPSDDSAANALERITAEDDISHTLTEFFDCHSCERVAALHDIISYIANELDDHIDEYDLQDHPITPEKKECIRENKEGIRENIHIFLKNKVDSQAESSINISEKLEEFKSTHYNTEEYRKFRSHLCDRFCTDFLNKNFNTQQSSVSTNSKPAFSWQHAVARHAQQHAAKKNAHALEKEVLNLEEENKAINFQRAVARSSLMHSNKVRQQNDLATISALEAELHELENSDRFIQSAKENAIIHNTRHITQQLAVVDKIQSSESIYIDNSVSQVNHNISNKNKVEEIINKSKLTEIKLIETKITRLETIISSKQFKVKELSVYEENMVAENRRLLAEKQRTSTLLANTKVESKEKLDKLSCDMRAQFNDKIKKFNLGRAAQIQGHNDRLRSIRELGEDSSKKLYENYKTNRNIAIRTFNHQRKNDSLQHNQDIAGHSDQHTRNFNLVNSRFDREVVLDRKKAVSNRNSRNNDFNTKKRLLNEEINSQKSKTKAQLNNKLNKINGQRTNSITGSNNGRNSANRTNRETLNSNIDALSVDFNSLRRTSKMEINQHLGKIDTLVKSEIDSSYQTIKFQVPN